MNHNQTACQLQVHSFALLQQINRIKEHEQFDLNYVETLQQALQPLLQASKISSSWGAWVA